VFIRGFNFFWPFPKYRTKEKESAGIDSGDITELVTSAGVVFIVNFHVLAHQETRQGHWHERAMQDSVLEANAGIFRKKSPARPAVKPADKNRDGQKNANIAFALWKIAWDLILATFSATACFSAEVVRKQNPSQFFIFENDFLETQPCCQPAN
jgi:hypothetical protein